MLEWLKNLKYIWSKFRCVWVGQSVRVATPVYDAMIKQLEDIHQDIKDVRQLLNDDKKMLIGELEKKDVVINAMIENLPDMLWFKDKTGKYIYANKAIRENLLFSNYPIGKTDVELALAAKERFGDRNHTFGEVCENSDVDVLENRYVGKPYVESAKVRGKMLHLEVNKSIVEIGGEVIGVVGIARDITTYREELVRNGQEDVFKKNEFINKDS